MTDASEVDYRRSMAERLESVKCMPGGNQWLETSRARIGELAEAASAVELHDESPSKMNGNSGSPPASSTGDATLDALAAVFDRIAPWRLKLRRLTIRWHDGRVPPSMRIAYLKKPGADGSNDPVSFEDIDAFDAKLTNEYEQLLEEIMVHDPEFGVRLESEIERLRAGPIRDLPLVGVIDDVQGLPRPKTLHAFVAELLDTWDRELYDRGHWFWFLPAAVMLLDPAYSSTAKLIEDLIAARRTDASRPPTSGVDNTSAREGPSEVDFSLTEMHNNLLRVLRDGGAVESKKLMKRNVIAQRARCGSDESGAPGNVRSALSELVRMGLLMSKLGAGGGYWLSEIGQRIAAQLS